ncbi:MAG: alpha/beta hydrolase [Bacteroidota bacterium]
MKDSKFNLSDWLTNKLNINPPKAYKDKLLGDIQSFTTRIKDDIQNKVQDTNHLVPILNGLTGDAFEENNDPLAIKFSFRIKNQDIPLNKLTDYYDFQQYSGKVSILIHGLMGDEYMWKALDPNDENKIGDWLEKKKTCHVLYLRYNTGLHISENGRTLSNLLEQLINQYGNKIKQVNLIGHSMGGLVIRSAGYYADIQRQRWTEKLKTIFLIGVPNEGSYLAQIGFFVGHVFRKMDFTNNDYIAKFMDIRSNGIKDLSYAYLRDDDWLNENAEDLDKYTVSKVRPIPGVKYYLIGGILGKKNNILSSYFGDGLVSSDSALTDELNTHNLENIESVIFEREDHLSLLESKQVVDYILLKFGTLK